MKFLVAALPAAAGLIGLALGASPVVQANPAKDPGAQVFATCRACHTLDSGGRSAMGPNLHGMFGRKAGSVAAFRNYTPALKASGIRWDEKTLDEYLANPTKMVPGTRMVVRVADPVKRKQLIAYLKAETAK
ncbi:cytochrome c family protein [Pelagerythrobacter sp.]|uniref:c-type cytochrome n=1 Tax=Pelagerythrobacter sp. TaxID=2800702 RepID=UPI0035ADD7BE